MNIIFVFCVLLGFVNSGPILKAQNEVAHFLNQCRIQTGNPRIEKVIFERISHINSNCIGLDASDSKQMMEEFIDVALTGSTSPNMTEITTHVCPLLKKYINCEIKFLGMVEECFTENYYDILITQMDFFRKFIHFFCNDNGLRITEYRDNKGYKCLNETSTLIVLSCLVDENTIDDILEDTVTEQPKQDDEPFPVVDYRRTGKLMCNIPKNKKCIVDLISLCTWPNTVAGNITSDFIDLSKELFVTACPDGYYGPDEDIMSEQVHDVHKMTAHHHIA